MRASTERALVAVAVAALGFWQETRVRDRDGQLDAKQEVITQEELQVAMRNEAIAYYSVELGKCHMKLEGTYNGP